MKAKNIKNYIFTALSLYLISSCQNQTKDQIKPPQEFEEISKGILVEKFDSLNKDESRYNLDNVIYTEKIRLKYTYSIVKDNKEKYVNSFKKDWVFVEQDDTSALELYFEAEILPGNPMEKFVPNYQQTNVRYVYPDGYSTMTGLIENTKNLWMHPPRAGIFSLLQLSGFPFVQYPLDLNSKYTWSLTSGSHYADKRFVWWDGNITTQMTYSVKSKQKVDTPFGLLDCYYIEATSNNDLGETQTKLYFNSKYGFVKTEFMSIDGTEININLTEIGYITDNIE